MEDEGSRETLKGICQPDGFLAALSCTEMLDQKLNPAAATIHSVRITFSKRSEVGAPAESRGAPQWDDTAGLT